MSNYNVNDRVRIETASARGYAEVTITRFSGNEHAIVQYDEGDTAIVRLDAITAGGER